MRRSWSIFLFSSQQPDNRALRAMRRLITAWNRDQAPAFESLPLSFGVDPWRNGTWHVTFDAATRDRLDELRAELARTNRSHGVVHRYSFRDHVDEQDYASADFVGLYGAAPRLDGTDLRNEETAFVPSPPCRGCPGQFGYAVIQTEPPVVDGAALERSAADEAPSPGGWDAVNLSSGQLLVSRRFASVLADNGIRGYQTRPVIDAATGEASRRLFQLVADTAVLVPCPEHSRVEDGYFCSVCGTGWGTLDGHWWVPDDLIGDDEVLSRHPDRWTMFYVSRRVYDLLCSSAPNGVRRHGVKLVCGHA